MSVDLTAKEQAELRRRIRARANRRKPKLSPEQRDRLVRDYLTEDISMSALGKRYGIFPNAVRFHINKALARGAK